MVVKIALWDYELDFIKLMADKATIGGHSHIRKGNRKQTVKEDNWSGQIGEAAIHKYWQGSLHNYAIHRWYQNRSPYQGDKGNDLAALNIDVKCSKWRHKNLEPIDHNMLVASTEYIENWIYILGLWEKISNNGRDGIGVHLVGWCTTSMLERNIDERFKAPWIKPGRELLSLLPIKWMWTY